MHRLPPLPSPRWPALLMVLAAVGLGCQSTPNPPRVRTADPVRTPGAPAASAPADWMAWRARRFESLAGTNGWTTLVARHWLTEGTNFAGANPTNHLVLPRGRAPAQLGRFIRRGNQVRFEAAPGVTALIDGQPVTRADLVSDLSNAPTRLVIGPLTATVIERGDRVGVRVRDPEAPSRQQFVGIDCFPYDPAWRLSGRFVPATAPRTLPLLDILGGTQELSSPGAIRFELGGQPYQLDVVEESGETDYFVLFRDRTAGDTTYGAGRFLYVSRPDADGRVVIDFNRAYTPPCGYTPYALCPLPPRQNWLPFPIPAGERKPPGH